MDEKHPASSQLTPCVVVVRVNGSHLIKNYLITFLALISGAWLSLARAPRLPRRTASFLPLSFSSPRVLLSISRSHRPHHGLLQPSLAPLSPVSCLLHLLLHPPSLLHSVHSQPAAKSLSWFAFFFSLPPQQPTNHPHTPLEPPRTPFRRQSTRRRCRCSPSAPFLRPARRKSG